MKRGGYVYIMTNQRNGTLYVGVTSRLVQRIYEHYTNAYPESFTARYKCHILVYYAGFDSIVEAIGEEKRIKAGSRKAKLKLIEGMNPDWKNLWEEIQGMD